MNRLKKRKKATSVLSFDFSTLYTKLPHNKRLVVLNSLIDFCFDGVQSKYITLIIMGLVGKKYQRKCNISLQTANKRCSSLSKFQLLFYC